MEKEEYIRIVNLYYDDVKRVALAECKNIYDAEDVAQATFMKLLNQKQAFNDDEHLKKWLIRVAVNECKTLWRSPWKTKVDFFVPERAAGGRGRDNVSKEVLEAVLTLKKKNREIIHLFYFEEYSAKEIAEILGISEDTVFKRLQRARGHLKKILEKK